MTDALPLLLDLLAPTECAGCEGPRAPGEPRLCAACRGELPLWPRPFAAPPLHWALGLGPYQGPLGSLIRQAKYRPDPHLIAWLADALAEATAGRLPEVDALVPVPVPLGRRLRRGFDQAERMACAVGRRQGRPVLDLLVRRSAREQAGRGLRDRQRGARGAFGVRGLCPPRVILVDDVWTTGATAQACAEELLLAGARRVGLLCLASTRL